MVLSTTLPVMFVLSAQIGNTSIPDRIIFKDMLESITWTRTKMIPNLERFFHKDLKDQVEVAGVEVEHRDLSLCYSPSSNVP